MDEEAFTQRELEILTGLSESLSDKEIADRLFLTVSTVKWYNRQIYSKLHVDNRKAAVHRAAELGLLERPRSTTNTRHNLPAELTPFIGRQSELAELAQQVNDPNCRLMTILAPGGMGKTRLALRCAGAQLENFPSGIFYVPLAPLRSSEYSALSVAEFVVAAIGNALNFPFSGEAEPGQQLLDYLREKVMLLVIDNCEHLLEGVTFLSDILAHAPQVKILATSRERLQLSGETTFVLGGLDFPERPTSDALAYGAIRLFVETARRVQTSFALSEDNLEHVIRICQLVDGMPLGIELAAGWSKLLPPREIAEEISRDLDMLASQQSDLPPRLRSARTVFEYSWNRLTASERDAFMKLSIFRGGMTREAAQAVTGASLTTLSGLVDKSLLWHKPDHRYEIHELLRQYAREHLESSGEMEAAQDAHCLYYLGFLSEREADIKGRRQLPALDEIEADFENVRAAWDWALTRKFYDALNQTPESLLWFCSMRGYIQAGVDLFRRAETQIDSAANETIWGRIASRGTRMRIMMKDYDNVLETLQVCLEIAQAHESKADIAFCLMMVGNTHFHLHDFNAAVPYYEKKP